MTTEKITTYGGVLIKGKDVLFDFSNTSVAFETLSSVSFYVECHVSDTLMEEGDSSYMAYVLLAIYVDGKEIERISIKPDTPKKERKLSFKRHQQVRIIKLSEAFTGIVCLKDLMKQKIKSIPKEEKVKVEFIGASLTSGYGNDGGKDSILDTDWFKTWGSQLCDHFNWEAVVHSYSCKGIVRDSSGSRENQLAERRRRIIGSDPSTVFDFSTFPASIVIINIGSNDFAYGGTDEFVELFVGKFKALIEEVYQQYGEKLVTILLDGPMTSQGVTELYEDIVSSFDGSGKKVYIVKSKLERPNKDLWGRYNHPTAAGHRLMAEHLIPQIEKIIQQ